MIFMLPGFKIHLIDAMLALHIHVVDLGPGQPGVVESDLYDGVAPMDKKTGEIMKRPVIKFKVGWAVPIKSSAEGKLVSDSHLERDEDGEWRLINNQLSIEELIGGEEG